jgi:ATP-dependent DNA helicase DinG
MNDKLIKTFFPYAVPREEQINAIEFGLKTFLNSDKKFCIIEAGTGVGKSAIGLTLGRILNSTMPEDPEYTQGSYFLTTQRVLQEQYENDFGKPSGNMCSVYSSKNYTCGFHSKNDCRTSMQMLRTTKKGSDFFKHCTQKCGYKKSKNDFLESIESVTNFPYFIMESTYSGKIKPRNLLVVDEAHNAESVLSNFVEVAVSQYFCQKVVKCKWPGKVTPVAFVKWIKNVYYPKLQSQILHFESQIESLGLTSKIKDLASVSLKYDMLTGHSNKIDVFLKDYSSENWVMEIQETEKRGYTRVVYRAIDVSKFAEEYLFRMGKKVILMSATILNDKGFASSLGIKEGNYDFISIPSPFPKENRPIFEVNVGSMSSKCIESTFPKLKQAVEAIMQEHKNEKGIIHCHTYRIARYLKYNIKSRKYAKRILIHNSDNRDEILQKHMASKEPTVLLSPSMTEGIDLKGDLSRFQIICKVPYPYLGDPIIRKRMNKNKRWYPMKTAMSIVQAYGRSVRSAEDTAVTYILDSDWGRFYSRNSHVFPLGFKESIVK